MLTSDSSFLFHIAELETAARLNLPLVCIVGVDHQWGLEVGVYKRTFPQPSPQPGVHWSKNVRFDKIAEGLGCHGEYVEHEHDIGRRSNVPTPAAGRGSCTSRSTPKPTRRRCRTTQNSELGTPKEPSRGGWRHARISEVLHRRPVGRSGAATALRRRKPATEQVSGRISLGSGDDVDAAVTAARRAFASWSQSSREERLELMQAILAEYQRRADDLAEAVTEEMGLRRRWPPVPGAARPGSPDDRYRRAEEFCVRRTARRYPGGQRADRGMRADHPVELAAQPDRGEGVSGAGDRLHNDLETVRGGPLLGLHFHRDPRCRRRAAGVYNLVNGDGAGWGWRCPAIPASTWCRLPVRRVPAPTWRRRPRRR
ncbi:thiamine pyrophosphate enzyme, C-terminal TPP binding domain protein [Mycobacterium xenopi 4042]|uniref:Thiamine pyrophosphate enzyme, C-terminal TPP binding domain protein n=1 Tax=Mycobacterium xenopi 4042 TaxID=1299334 RepID=X8CKU3_MYCXE|nr:thiamine pyrophosphate enzyme, C-terminal TPP binding domain protein [Mycobacterium xenopi 4042]